MRSLPAAPQTPPRCARSLSRARSPSGNLFLYENEWSDELDRITDEKRMSFSTNRGLPSSGLLN